MKATLVIILVVAALVTGCYFGGCSYRNVDTIKAAAPARLEELGFEVVGYEGYMLGGFSQPGGLVWYVVQRRGDDSVRYNCAVSKWGDEMHVYYLRAIDALAPSR